MSLRLRLALWYAIITALAFAVLSVGLYSAFANTAQREIDREMERAVSDARGLVAGAARGPQSGPSPGRTGQPRSPRGTFNPPRVVPFGPPSAYFQTLDAEGGIVGQSPNLEGTEIPISIAILDELGAGRAVFQSITLGDQPVRVYSAPLNLPNANVAYIQVARSIADIESLQANLRVLLIAAAAVTIVVATAVGWLVSQAALSPLESITETAESIGNTNDLTRRIEHHGPRDEVGRLATTFNVMMARLQGSYQALSTALDVQRRFTADASHELRTPVTSIRVNAETLLRNPDMAEADRQAALTDITGEADRMGRLINQLLTLARADAGFNPAFQPVRLGAVVQAAVRRLEPLAGGRSIVTRIDTGGDGAIEADADLLRQVVIILGDNALRYGGEGPIEVSLRREPHDYVIAVADQGPGVPAEDMTHLFERFYRGKRATGDGSGLGLAIAAWIVDVHGGRIDVVSEPHHGATFSVRLPVPV